MNHAHSSLTDQHFTPPAIVNAARYVMGRIDLDPCTSYEVNQWSVNATQIFTSDGLTYLNQIPDGAQLKVWCNPPGGKTGNQSNMKLWIRAIIKAWHRDAIAEAFFLMFNREFLGMEEIAILPQLNFPDRIKYWSFNEVTNQFQEGNWTISGKGNEVLTLHQTGNIWQALNWNNQPMMESESKTQVKSWCRDRNFQTKEWTNSPTHQSTLLYFPDITKDTDWSLLQSTFEKHQVTGRWVIPLKF